MKISSEERLKKCVSKIKYLKSKFKDTDAEVKNVSAMLAPFIIRFGVRYEEVPEGKKRIVKVAFSPHGIFFRGVEWIYFPDEEINMMSKTFALSAIMIYPSLLLSENFPGRIKKMESKCNQIKNQLSEKKIKSNEASTEFEKLEKSMAKLQAELNESKSQMGLIRTNTEYSIEEFDKIKHKIPLLN